LDPLEYERECHKLIGAFMPSMKFWSGDKDVVHHDDVDPGKYPALEGLPIQICNKTITYMLDGHVGLLADLALMAQASGLAREVNCLALLTPSSMLTPNYSRPSSQTEPSLSTIHTGTAGSS